MRLLPRLPAKTIVSLVIFLLALQTGVQAEMVELSLDECVALALKNNPAVKIVEADKEKAFWAVKEAAAGKGVSITYTHSDTREKYPPSTIRPYYSFSTTFDNNFTLSLPLYSGGRLEGLIEKAKINAQIADQEVSKTKQQIMLNAITAYYNVLQARNMLQVNQESVDSLAAHLKNVELQYDVGIVAKSDVLRSQVELANAQQNLIKAQNAYDLSLANLNNVIGLPLDSQIKVKEELTREPYTLSLDQSVEYALANRPEFFQAKATIDSARQGVRVAKSGFLPSLSLSGSMDWNDHDFPGAKNNNWSVVLAVSLNVFDSGLTRAKINEAQMDVDKAREQARQTKDGISLEVRQAYLNMKEAEKRIDTSGVAVTKAEEDFKIARIRYSAGVGTNLDVIDAQVALTQAKTNYVQSLYDYNASRANLNKAMGIGMRK